jgi:hypothetical protein
VVADSASGTVSVRALYRPAQFNRGPGLHNHHLIVWQGGKAAANALLVALSPDSAIHDALVSIGARPGNNLTADAWDKRGDPASLEPDRVAEGSALGMTIEKAGKVWQVTDIAVDQGSRRYALRFAGNRALIGKWRSGCVVCLESCPGSKVSNSTYTMRDLAKGRAQFAVKEVEGLVDGDTVVVRLSLLP